MSLPANIESESSWVLGLPVIEENNPTGQSDKPMLQFSLHYDIQQSTLMVHLHHASNLPAKDRQGTSDPFVVLHLTPNKEETFQSAVIYKTLNPVFDQSFQFQGLTPDDIRRQTLIFRIFDHDRFTRNDSIGMVALPLQNADLYGVVMRMLVQDEEEVRIDLDSLYLCRQIIRCLGCGILQLAYVIHVYVTAYYSIPKNYGVNMSKQQHLHILIPPVELAFMFTQFKLTDTYSHK
jgi:hypothetical protein